MTPQLRLKPIIVALYRMGYITVPKLVAPSVLTLASRKRDYSYGG